MEDPKVQIPKAAIHPLTFNLFLFIFTTALLVMMPLVATAATYSVSGLADSFSPEEVRKAVVRADYGKLPLSFIQNDGQVDKQVKFYEKGSGRITFFTKDGIYLSLTDRQSASTTDNAQSALIKLMLLGANKHPKIVAEGMQGGKVNYFIGNDPKKWKTNIPTYQAVVYKELYPGIDMKFYGNNRQIEYDIIIKPGADPSKVKFGYEGIKGLRITDEGNLEISMKGGTILQKKPIVYQEIDGKQVNLNGKFKILEHKDAIGQGDNKEKVVTFAYAVEVAKYEKNHPLIIDPVLVYSTYLGGSNFDEGSGITVDTTGNAYVTGRAYSTNFPTASPLQGNCSSCSIGTSSDAFVAKINSAGSALVYSTYLGGNGGDIGIRIAVDDLGNAYVTGQTTSTNFPTANALQPAIGSIQDAFVTKLNAAGSALIYSTYLGGNSDDNGQGIAVDGSGNAYVTGATRSTNFPTASPLQMANAGNFDAFVVKINSSGSTLIYSTYLGGHDGDYGYGIAVDSLGNAYVTGETNSTDFPTINSLMAKNYPYADAFVTKINSSGSALVYSTYLGGNIGDFAYDIAVDSSGNAYVIGTTSSTNFPTVNALQTAIGGNFDAFVTKINSAGSALIYSTYLGGSDNEAGGSIAVDGLGDAYVTGSTTSSNFPTANAIQGYGGGNCQVNFFSPCNDAFVAKINPNGSAFVYSTYLGGSRGDNGSDIAVDGSGNAYVTGHAGSTDFPTKNAFQPTGGDDAFVAKIGEPSSTTTTTTTTTTTSTTTTTTCNDQNKGNDKDKGKGHDKGRCKGHG